MILVWGSLDDPPVARVLDALRRRGVELVHLGDEQLADLRYDVELAPAPTGWIEVGGRRIGLQQLTGIYLRPGDVRDRRAIRAATALLAVADVLPGTVVNRPLGGRSNASKPFQVGLLARGRVRAPDTLVTTDPAAARRFLARHGRIIYKSISGVRSIVAALEASDVGRLDDVASGPVQLQEWVEGIDVRAHVVGETCIATAVTSEATDYRYARSSGDEVTMWAVELPQDVEHHLVEATHRLGLLLSGVDLRHTPSGDWYVFEANPSPGFSYYEDHTGQPIADAIAGLLVGTGDATLTNGMADTGRSDRYGHPPCLQTIV